MPFSNPRAPQGSLQDWTSFSKADQHLRRILKIDPLHLLGPNGAKDEFLLATADQNHRKLSNLIALPVLLMPA